MPQKKQLAKGTLVKVNGTTRGRIETFTPPGREFNRVDAPELNPQDDAGSPLPFDPMELGDEVPGEFSWTEYYDPRNADATSLDSLMEARAAVAFALVTPHATSATISFSGKIVKLGTQQLTKQGYYKRDVTCIRTSAITNAATT